MTPNAMDRRFSNTSSLKDGCGVFLGSDLGTPSRLNGKSNTAFGLNRKILNPYIIFQKNSTTVIEGATPFYKTAQKLKAAGYENQLESYKGQLDGIKSLLTQTAEKPSHRLSGGGTVPKF